MTFDRTQLTKVVGKIGLLSTKETGAGAEERTAVIDEGQFCWNDCCWSFFIFDYWQHLLFAVEGDDKDNDDINDEDDDDQ